MDFTLSLMFSLYKKKQNLYSFPGKKGRGAVCTCIFSETFFYVAVSMSFCLYEVSKAYVKSIGWSKISFLRKEAQKIRLFLLT